MPDIIQLKVSLKHSNPLIWRRILVEGDMSFEDLHLVIQYAMGWENCHLYCFNFDGIRLSSSPHVDDGYLEDNKFEDASIIRIGSVLKEHDQQFLYEYDFGDSWIHDVTVEQFLNRDKKIIYPVCLAGEMNCPPEDCGGIPGYLNLLEVMSGPDSPEKDDIIDWLGSFDPEEFNIDYTNRLLSRLGD
jgi:hypothetical protein